MAEATVKVGRAQGRKPVHQSYQTLGYVYPQDAVWEAIRALKKFSRADLAMWLVRKQIDGINDSTISSYVERLHRGAFIEHIDTQLYKGVSARHIYQLVIDKGREAPRLREDGTPVTQGLGTEQMWRSMRVLGDFTFRELAVASTTEVAAVSEITAKSYIAHLYAAGYLHMLPRNNRNEAARYKLLPTKITGPRPPMVQRTKRVFDPNLNKVVWREDEL